MHTACEGFILTDEEIKSFLIHLADVSDEYLHQESLVFLTRFVKL
jgi:hypothetical protein